MYVQWKGYWGDYACVATMGLVIDEVRRLEFILADHLRVL